MNQFDTIPMTDENIIIKARHVVSGELVARKLVVNKDIKLDDLEYKLRERFNTVEKVCTYPHIIKGKFGELVEVLIESRWLTITNATREDTIAWGTDIFTDDSDIIKAITHSEKVDLTDTPPQHDLVVTVRYLPGCLKYNGTSRQGITTLSYGPYELSYMIEDIKAIPITNEKSVRHHHHTYDDQRYDTVVYE
ncbi:Rxt3-domain-containing protein [Gigaspora margarita]|uniref:Rxt3-domain-containing protein n=1 Tax=Gigaspora margarita TaxID=4874 RepID=A0A8H3XGB3_GIGMA|nr:Rxt3-domain-containing protein [Gigaspora margarita]